MSDADLNVDLNSETAKKSLTSDLETDIGNTLADGSRNALDAALDDIRIYMQKPRPEEVPDEPAEREAGDPMVFGDVPKGRPQVSDEDVMNPPDQKPGYWSDLAKQLLVGGPRDAFVESMQTIGSVGDHMRDNGIAPFGFEVVSSETINSLDDFFGGKYHFKVPEVAKSEYTSANVGRAVTQFISGMAVPGAALYKLKSVGTIARGATAGFASDAVAHDPDEANLSRTINELAEANKDAEGFFSQLPVALQGTITEVLANNPTDSEFEKRMKKGLEGVFIGIPFEAMMTGLRIFRATRNAKKLVAENEAMGRGAAKKRVAGSKKGAGKEIVEKVELPEPKRNLFDPPDQHEKLSRQFVDPLEVRVGGKKVKIDMENVDIEWDKMLDGRDLIKAMKSVAAKVQKQLGGKGKKIKSHVYDEQEAFESAMRDLSDDFDGTMRRVILSSERTDADRNVFEAMRVAHGKRLHRLMRDVLAGDMDAMEALPRQLAMGAEIESLTRTLPSTLTKDLDLAFKNTGTGFYRDFNEMALEMMTRMRQFIPDWDAIDVAYRLNALTKSSVFRRFTQQSSRPGYFDGFLEYWLNAILSGFDILGRNSLTSGFYLAAQIPTRVIAAGVGSVDRALGGKGGVRWGEIARQFYGMQRGLTIALGPFIKNIYRVATLRDPVLAKVYDKGSGAGPSLQKFQMDNNITADNYQNAVNAMNKILSFPFRGGIDFETPVALAIDLFGRVVRTWQNAIASFDEPLRITAFEMERATLSYREAVNSGKTGAAQIEHMNKLYDHAPRKVLLPHEEQARKFGDQMAFVDEMTGTPAAIEELVQHVPGMRMVEPFLRTRVSLFRALTDNSPLSLAGGALGYFGKRMRGNGNILGNGTRTSRALEKGGADRHIAIARTMLGSYAGFEFYRWAAEGGLTGSWHPDRAMRNVQKANGFQPNSFKLEGGSWIANLISPDADKGEVVYFSHKALEPWSKMMTFAADASLAIPKIKDPQTRADASMKMAEAFGSTMMDAQFASGYWDLMGALQSGQGVERALSKFSGSLVPRIVQQGKHYLDPVKKDLYSPMKDPFTDEWRAYEKFMQPIFQDQLLPDYDSFGQPGFYPPNASGNFLNIMPSSIDKNITFLNEMEKHEVGILEPDKLVSVDIGGKRVAVGLTDKEHNDLQKFIGLYENSFGMNFHEHMNNLVAGFKEPTEYFQIMRDDVGKGSYYHNQLKANIESFRSEAIEAFLSWQGSDDYFEILNRAKDQNAYNEMRGQKTGMDLGMINDMSKVVQK